MTQEQYETLRNPKMYPHTKFWIPTSHNIHILSGFDLSKTVARGQRHRDPKPVRDTPWPIDIEARGQGHSCLEVLRYNLQHPDASIYKI